MGSKGRAGWTREAELCFAFCKGLDTPRSLAVNILMQHGEIEQLASLKVDPASYLTAEDFAVDYAATNFFKKSQSLQVDGLSPRKAAILGFHQSEGWCRETNELVRALASGGAYVPDPDVDAAITAVRQKIADILGPVPVSFDHLYDWGPGATDDLKKSQAYPDEKLTKLPITVTKRAFPHLCRAILADKAWIAAIAARNSFDGFDERKLFKIVEGSVYDTVTKTVLTDRSINKEPRGNGFLQKGIGRFIRERLLLSGCDLNNQAHNQCLAEMAYHCDLATLDLESASDSVSKELVHFLLPIDWATLLADLRSERVKIDNGWLELEKFSSMGNGFTFELESLIFFAIVSTVSKRSGRRLFGVYGDDIVVHRDDAPLVTELLRTFGFRLNKSKSFVEGNFYESCGKHYFCGEDVTPAYQKERLESKGSYARCSVRLLHLAARLGAMVVLDKRVKPAYEHVLRESRTGYRDWGPIDFESNDYVQVPLNQIAGKIRFGSFGEYATASSFREFSPDLPQFEDAIFALTLRRRNAYRISAFNSWLSGGPIGQLKNLQMVSIPTNEDNGIVGSRKVKREITQHRRVQVPVSTACLDW